MDNRIELKFSNTITRLAGNPYGQEIFMKQVKNNVKSDKLNIIVIPDYIEDIAISFVQGFCEKAFETIGKEEFYKYYKIEGREKVVTNFNKYIFY